MRTVALKTLQNDLETYVRAAEAGETVLVTDGTTTLAKLVPANDSTIARFGEDARPSGTHETVIERGIREGWITPATVPPTAPLPPRKPVMTTEELMRGLDESREDRF